MEIVRRRRQIWHDEWSYHYDWRDFPGSGFSFPCTKDGVILREEILQPAGLANLEACLSGEYDVIDLGVQDTGWWITEPAQGRCSTCGHIVELNWDPSECEECGALYNLFGQDLAPRHCWDPRGEY